MLKDLKYLIKVIPFYIAGLYLLYMGVWFFSIKEETLLICDLFIYAGPTYAIPFIFLSLKAGFCNWHRTAIIIPLISGLSGYVDSYLCKFNIEIEYTNVIALITLSAVTIFCGIKVLWKNKQ